MQRSPESDDVNLTVVNRRKLMQLTGISTAAIVGSEFLGSIPSAGAQSSDRPVLRVGLAGLPDSLDPQLTVLNQRTLVDGTLFNNLLMRNYLAGDPPGTGAEPAPGLATAWNRVDDLTLEVTLREGVTFHDGSPLTADDVKFTFDRMLLDPDNFVQSAATIGTIKSVEIVNPATVRFATESPDPLLEKRLTTFVTWIVPKAYFERVGADAFGLSPVGTGPYKLVEFHAEDSLILESHDAYWGGLPPASRIEFRVIPEIAARVAALSSGEIDIATGILPDQIETIASTDGLDVRGVQIMNFRTIYYNTRSGPLTDVRLRHALNVSIDRQLIIDTLWNGQAVLPRGPQFENYGPLFDADRPYPAYDPDQAKSLMAEAGYAGDLITMWLPVDYYTLGAEVAQAIIEMWNEVGFNAELQLVPVANLNDNAETKTMTSGSNGNEFADPDAWWFRWAKGSTVAKFYWTAENPRFEEAGLEARSILDVEERLALYKELMDIWDEEAPGTVLYIPIEQYGVRSDISWQPYGDYVLDFGPANLKFS